MPYVSKLAFAQSPDRPFMPIPALVNGSDGPVSLKMQTGLWSFDGKIKTPTWGLSQDYMGPVVRTRRGAELALHYENTLAEAVSIHGHGLHVTGELDGGPQRAIRPGTSWSPILPIVQEAATLWYHSHTHKRTGPHVYNGLAGMIVIDDDNSDSLPLPRRYGIDDLPFIVQDKDFNQDGTLLYNKVGLGRFYAEHMTVNGIIQPRVEVPKGLVRLRLLNGSNGRFFNFTFTDTRVFHVIAGDGGFLEEPVEVTTLFVAPGERYELLVDFSDGLPATLRSVQAERGEGTSPAFNPIQGEQTICTFEVNPRIAPDLDVRVPPRLNDIAWLDPKEAHITRHFTMATINRKMVINGRMMDMARIDHRVQKGAVEIWDLDGDVHNFHAHGCSFQVLSINGKTPPAHMKCWKDTVITDAKASFIVRFDHTASDAFPYMFHCHLLEHEDMGMMGQFTVEA